MVLALLLAVFFTLLMTMVELPHRSGTPLRYCLNPETLPYLGLTTVAHVFTTFLAFYAPIPLGSLEAGRFFLAAIFGVFAAQTVLRHVKIPVFDGEPDIPRWREKALAVAMRAARHRRREERKAAASDENEPRNMHDAGTSSPLAGSILLLCILLGAFFLGRASFLQGSPTSSEDLSQAHRMLEAGDLPQAERWAAAKIVAKDPHLRAEAEWILAKVRTKERRLDEAQELAESARSGFEQSGDALGEARTLRLLGQIVHDRGHRDWAAQRYREALKIIRSDAVGSGSSVAEEKEVAEEKIATLVDLAILRAEESALQEARETLDEALYQAKLHGSRRSAEIYGNLAEVLRRAGELTTAARHFETARDLFRERDDARGEAWSRLGLADVHRTLGDLASAEDGYAAARRLFGEQDPTGIAWALHGEGKLHVVRGDFLVARRKLEESLASHTSREEARWAVAVRMTLAELALVEGNPREASTWADSAAQELEREGRHDLAARAYALGALARLAEGDLERAGTLAARTIDARRSEELEVRLTVFLAAAHHAFSGGDLAAEGLARQMLQQARGSGHLVGQWEARLLWIEIAGTSEASAVQAAALAADASSSGHLEIARRACRFVSPGGDFSAESASICRPDRKFSLATP